MATLFRGFVCARPSSLQQTIFGLSRQHKALQFKLKVRSSIVKRFFAAKTRPAAHHPDKVFSKAVKPTLDPRKSTSQGYTSIANVLATRPSPTLLYQASAPILHVTICFIVGSFCITYSIYHVYFDCLYPPEGLNKWIPQLWGGICGVMAGLGMLFTFRAFGFVRTITAIPSPAKSSPRALHLQIEGFRILPLVPRKILSVPHTNIVLSSHLFTPELKLTPAQLIESQRRELRQRQRDRSRILTLPFRQANYWLWRGFMVMKKMLTLDGLVLVQVQNKNGVWKLDTNAAWMLDDGRILDRLVKRRFE